LMSYLMCSGCAYFRACSLLPQLSFRV
jgi:hypothetical protein